MRNTTDTQQDPETTMGRLLTFPIERIQRPFMTEAEFLAVLAGRPTGGFLFAPGEVDCIRCAWRDRKVIARALRGDRSSPFKPTSYLATLPVPCRFCGCSYGKRVRTARGKDSQ